MTPARIVLIEDNEADVHLVELALKEFAIPYSLTRFERGIDAVQALCASTEQAAIPPNLILLDLNTPRTDGFEALVSLRRAPQLAGVPIAILTSSDARSDKHRAAIQGARYIEKPFELEDFLNSVGQAVKEMLGTAAGR